jgi:hypothetical protein
VLVSFGQEDAVLPLSVYLPGLRLAPAAGVATRELDFFALRTRRTGRAPLLPAVSTRAPAGFRLVAVRRTETYALARFLATHRTRVSGSSLRHSTADASAEAIAQR